jgi:hypothetical protein
MLFPLIIQLRSVFSQCGYLDEDACDQIKKDNNTTITQPQVKRMILRLGEVNIDIIQVMIILSYLGKLSAFQRNRF